MKRKNSMNHGRLTQRLAVATVASLISLAAYGQATVDPATQPFMTLAPYVLKSSNLEPRVGNTTGGTRAYRPWFENGAWTGDLIEYEIEADGRRVPRNDIGRFPRNGNDWRGTSTLWSARYVFRDFQPYDPNDASFATWECVEEDTNYWRDPDPQLAPTGSRNIFTIRNTNSKIPFLWNELTPNQRRALDQITAAIAINDDTVRNNPYASDILNYVRGDRSLERCKQGGVFRWRHSLLGAIVNSRPVYVPPSSATGADLVVVGANSGMLHGFDAADGRELWAYLPSLILDRVGLQREPGTRPRYLMDGELRHRDIGTPTGSRQIVTGGLGAGGKGLFVLDVTNPGNPAVVTEIAGVSADHIGGAADERIGYIHGRPTIARLPGGTNGRWYVVSGNGYASTFERGKAFLVLIPLDGAPTPIFMGIDDSVFLSPGDAEDNGLSAPSLVDVTGNGIADYAYAGDLKGNLWRFDLSDTSAYAQLVFAAGVEKPIVVEPDIARHPVTNDGFMIYFGTGSLLSGADVDVRSTQSAFGIWDRPGLQNWLPVTQTNLVTQELKTAEVTWDIPTPSCGDALDTATTTVRFIHNQQPLVWSGSSPNKGWQVDLPRAGERIIGHPQVRAERIQFITTNPYDMANPPADPTALKEAGSWMLQLDLTTGGNALRARALFDLNKDCTLSVADGAPPNSQAFDNTAIPLGNYPVGVNLGAFNIAQPAFARVRFDTSVGSVVDGVYINALSLPPQDPPGNVIHGPLDVMTDSPNGPSHAPLPEPMKLPVRNPDFPEASGPTKPYLRADGLGHRVDGHSMGYNKHHGVNYVDLFTLEPRRGQTRLDVGVMYDDGGTPEPIVLDPNSPTGTGLRTSERELNRVQEVIGITDNQRFIIVLSNADLSRGNQITIGDNTWPVYAYQTRVMSHLVDRTTGQMRPHDEMMARLLADNLVFTLRGDFNPICPPSRTSCENRLRITPTERIGSQDATMGTLPGCVNNTDRYIGESDSSSTRKRRYVSGQGANAVWETILDATGNLRSGYTLADLYADGAGAYMDNPHATPYPPPSGNQAPRELGYRWRNGALTVQLLAVNSDNTPAFEIQDSVHLPRPNTGVAAVEGIDIGWGGAYAKAFNVVGGVVVPINNPPGSVASGMLYELSMFWHWGDMARLQSQGGGDPVIPKCYGTRDYVPSLTREVDWFTYAAYSNVTAGFTEDLQRRYLALLAEIAAGGNVDDAVRRLQEFLNVNNLTNYHSLRHYVPNSRHLQDHQLIMIDRGDWSTDVTLDGTPVDVIDVERDLLPSLGPNYQPGRRSWIDLVPE